MARQNKFYAAAHRITTAMNPDGRLFNSELAKTMTHLSMLCGKKAQGSGETVYDVEDVEEAFYLLKKEFDAKGLSCGVLTLLKGTPKNIDRLLSLPEPPAIYDSAAYDDWVRKNARRLRKQGYRYVWSSESSQSDGSRMGYDEAFSLGLAD